MQVEKVRYTLMDFILTSRCLKGCLRSLVALLAIGSYSLITLLLASPVVYAESYVYEDTNGAPLTDITTDLCMEPLSRTFTITDSFRIENLQIGFVANHTYRSDVRLVLYSPAKTKVEILTEFFADVEDEYQNYDIVLADDSLHFINDGDDDDTTAPYYERTVQPSNPLAKFIGENARGEWRLEICDAGIGDGGAYLRSRLQFTGTPVPLIPPDQISGLIFRDANADGIHNATEIGLGDITVYAYAEDQLLATTKTDASGAYSLTVNSGVAVRLEFVDAALYLQAGYHGGNSATTVTFVQSPARAVDVAFQNPGQYCQAAANTQLLATCFYYGAHDGAFNDRATIFTFGETAGSNRDVADATAATAYDPPTRTPMATQAQTGAVWGVAYNQSKRTAYVGSFVKRHVGLGQTGNPTTIYAVDLATNSTRPWLTFDPTRPDPHAGTVDWAQDFAVFDQVGKEGWGDLDIAEDGTHLYAIDLGRRQLVSIPIQTDGAPGTPSTVDLVTAFPSNLVGPAAEQCPTTTDIRPFGLGVHNGVVYIGVVCSAQSTVPAGALPIQAPTDTQVAGQRPGDVARLRGYVLAWNGSSAAPELTPVLNFPLNYDRGCVTYNHEAGCERRYDARWAPWVNTFPYTNGGTGETFEAMYPQPTLSDIEFFQDDMILFLGDRFGHQSANFTASPHGDGPAYMAASGDILYACKRSAGWVMEELFSGDATCGTAGKGFVRGPERIDEYFFEDTYRALYLLHDDIGLGAGAVIPGRNEVISAVYDPVYRSTTNTTNQDAGLHWYSIDDGHWRKAVRLYDGNGNPVVEGFLQKASGLGDLTALCDPAPVEIGNRIWHDQDRDGVQDGAEPGIGGVTVWLLRPGLGADGIPGNSDDGNPLATVQSASDGTYYFSSAPGADVAGADYGVDMHDNTAYRLCLPNATGSNQQPALNDYGLTVQNAAPTPARADWRDSDGALLGTSACLDLTVGAPGFNDHTYDFGFYQNSLAAIGDYVWLDKNRDGDQDSNESGLGGVTVQLCDTTGQTLAETTSDANGSYSFASLPPGFYGIRFTPPPDYRQSPSDQGSDDTLDSDAPAAGTCTPVTALVAGENDVTWDAGFYPLYDWGDLPDTNPSYATRSSANGPSHQLVANFYLGACVDDEGDGQPALPGQADGDDQLAGGQLSGASACDQGDDEDGVFFTTPLIAGADACVRITAVQPGYVNAFIDFSGGGLSPLLFTRQDGVSISQPSVDNLVAAGSHEYCFAVPATTQHAGLLYSRFRLSRQGGLAAVGAAPDGEVEDYVQPLACVGNFVWSDQNGNGKQESGEPGLAGVTVQLVWGGPDGNLQSVADNQTFTTATDAQGEYHFCGLLPTTAPAYQVRLPTLPGTATKADATTAESDDSDGDPQGRGPAFALPLPLARVDDAVNDQGYEQYTDAQDDLTFDFGFYQPAAIGNLVWHDLDQDGRQDAGEPGVGNVTVKLYRADGTLVNEMVTDADGHYQFTNLPPGSYRVEFVLPPSFIFSPSGHDLTSDQDSNVDLITRQTVLIPLHSGEVNPTWDAGIFQGPTALTEADEPGSPVRTFLYLPLIRE